MTDRAALLDIHDGIARITLNRPQAMNSLNLEMAKDLMDVALHCETNAAVRAVVLTGAGDSFCAGGDIKSFITQGDQLPAYLKSVTAYLHTALSCFARMDAPVVAAVRGSAAGAGMSLACASDLTVATESARFTAAYTRIGLTPDGSLTYMLPRLIGIKRALELTLTNRRLSAQEAYDWGIVTAVVPDGQELLQAETFARQLAAGATQALGATKRLIHQGWGESLETQMMHERQAISDFGATANAQEGISAFLAKRPPHFT